MPARLLIAPCLKRIPILIALVALVAPYMPVFAQDTVPGGTVEESSRVRSERSITTTTGLAGQPLPFLGDNLSWQSAASEDVTVYWTTQDNTPGTAAIEVARETNARLDLILPVSSADPVNVYIFPTTAALRQASLQAGYEWSDDSILVADAIWVTAVNPRTALGELTRSIPQQMLSQRLASLDTDQQSALPLWFYEGLNGLFEGEKGSGYDPLVRQAVEKKALIPFESLCKVFPQEAGGEALARAESVALLAHIQDEYGDGALAQLATAYFGEADCADGPMLALNRSMNQLEDEWLATRYGKLSMAQFWRTNGLWLLLLLLGLTISGLLMLPIRKGQ